MGSPGGAPGESVVVPVYLTPGEGIRVGSLILEISFVSTNLKLDKAERGIAAERGGVDVSTSSRIDKDEKGLEVSTVRSAVFFIGLFAKGYSDRFIGLCPDGD